MYTAALNKIRQFALESFKEANTSKLYYHNLTHTTAVVDQIAEMSNEYDSRTQCLLQISAWLHDIGYLYGYQQHEARSIDIAKQHWSDWGLQEKDFELVKTAIAATELGVSPSNELAALLADADLFYGVGDHFFQHGPLLRKEWEACKKKFYTNLEWEELQLNFLQSIIFESHYGKQYFTVIVKQNLEKQIDILRNVSKI